MTDRELLEKLLLHHRFMERAAAMKKLGRNGKQLSVRDFIVIESGAAVKLITEHLAEKEKPNAILQPDDVSDNERIDPRAAIDHSVSPGAVQYGYTNARF